nr:immunoglobulin light chain junction region [Macaca mulatta]MPN94657.1 immunoglobulin light chain junction region [Macaca mulatta]MPN95041.1 immunoglobulin light chain junction region [Macaca mulatta]MPN97439.1 immunoglobulin light chain junction region [Macaca mulatta]
CQQCNSLPYSC